MNEHENQTMKIFGKRLTASLLGAALVMSMPFEIGRRRVGKECRSRWSPYH